MALELGLPFSSHLVLQRDRPNALWGWDTPGQTLELTVEGAGPVGPVRGRADAQGAFRFMLPPVPAGGPYRVVVAGSQQVVLEDVLSGEVWLASGQSNMEWKVGSSAHAEDEVRDGDLPGIRVLTAPRRAAWEAEPHGLGEWVSASPQTVGSFSAIGYAFARELHQRLGVPVGLIDASWGGTPIAAWMSLPALRAVDAEVDEELAARRAEEPHRATIEAAHAEKLRTWERGVFPQDPPNSVQERGFARPDFDDRDWRPLRLPSFWQDHGMRFNGVVWFRRAIEVPARWAGRELRLSLGAIDDFDHTYVDGELVGAHPAGTPLAHQLPRHYSVPANLVRGGRQVLTVRVFDHFGQGGFVGPSPAMRVAPVDAPDDALPLAGEWLAFAEHPIPLVPASVFATYPPAPPLLTPHYRAGSLHHGMLAALAPYGLRGFLWYQGESDVERHARYAALQVALVRDLRAAFAQGQLPFLLVELAGYRASPHWPFLREAQQRATVEPNTGLCTARDLGDPDDIHPRDKRSVAHRLALLARARVYGETDLVCTGPALEHVELIGSQAKVWFQTTTGLRSRGGERLQGFTLAGGDGVFHAAQAVLTERCVVLTAPEVTAPVHVRYAWSDTGEGDLENGAGLPALSFRTDGLAGPR